MTVESRARTRSVEEMRELGRRVGEHLRGGAYVAEAADREGIPQSTYHSWLNGKDEAAMAFRQGAMAGYYAAAHEAQEQAERDIMGSDKGPSGPHASYHKWLLEKRFPAVFGQAAQQIEHSGPNGGPIDVRDLSTASDKDLLGLLAATKTKADDAE